MSTEQVAPSLRDVTVQQAPQPPRRVLTQAPVLGYDTCQAADEADCAAEPETVASGAGQNRPPANPPRRADPPRPAPETQMAARAARSDPEAADALQAARLAAAQRDAETLRDALGGDVAGVLAPPKQP